MDLLNSIRSPLKFDKSPRSSAQYRSNTNNGTSITTTTLSPNSNSGLIATQAAAQLYTQIHADLSSKNPDYQANAARLLHQRVTAYWRSTTIEAESSQTTNQYAAAQQHTEQQQFIDELSRRLNDLFNSQHKAHKHGALQAFHSLLEVSALHENRVAFELLSDRICNLLRMLFTTSPLSVQHHHTLRLGAKLLVEQCHVGEREQHRQAMLHLDQAIAWLANSSIDVWQIANQDTLQQPSVNRQQQLSPPGMQQNQQQQQLSTSPSSFAPSTTQRLLNAVHTLDASSHRDKNQLTKHFAACCLIAELASAKPWTPVTMRLSRICDVLWSALRENHPDIRIEAQRALAACLVLLRNLRSTDANTSLTPASSGITANSVDALQQQRTQAECLEALYREANAGLSVSRSNTLYVVGSLSVLLQLLQADTQQFMRDRFEPVARCVLQFCNTSSSQNNLTPSGSSNSSQPPQPMHVQKCVLQLLMSLAALSPRAFAQRYMTPALEFISELIQNTNTSTMQYANAPLPTATTSNSGANSSGTHSTPILSGAGLRSKDDSAASEQLQLRDLCFAAFGSIAIQCCTDDESAIANLQTHLTQLSHHLAAVLRAYTRQCNDASFSNGASSQSSSASGTASKPKLDAHGLEKVTLLERGKNKLARTLIKEFAFKEGATGNGGTQRTAGAKSRSPIDTALTALLCISQLARALRDHYRAPLMAPLNLVPPHAINSSSLLSYDGKTHPYCLLASLVACPLSSPLLDTLKFIYDNVAIDVRHTVQQSLLHVLCVLLTRPMKHCRLIIQAENAIAPFTAPITVECNQSQRSANSPLISQAQQWTVSR
jgi:hypothetical protein